MCKRCIVEDGVYIEGEYPQHFEEPFFGFAKTIYGIDLKWCRTRHAQAFCRPSRMCISANALPCPHKQLLTSQGREDQKSTPRPRKMVHKCNVYCFLFLHVTEHGQPRWKLFGPDPKHARKHYSAEQTIFLLSLGQS